MGVVLESDSDDEEKKETKKIVEKEEEESEVRSLCPPLCFYFLPCFTLRFVNIITSLPLLLLLRGEDTFENVAFAHTHTHTHTHSLSLSLTRSFSLSISSRRKPKARTKKKKKTNNQRKRSKRKTKSQRRKKLIRIRKTQTSSTIYPAMKSTLRSSFPVAGPLDRPGRCLRSKCTRRRTWTTSQRTKSERNSFFVFDLKIFFPNINAELYLTSHIFSLHLK